MTRKQIINEKQRIRRHLRFLKSNKASIIRRGGKDAYKAMVDEALSKIVELNELLKKL